MSDHVVYEDLVNDALDALEGASSTERAITIGILKIATVMQNEKFEEWCEKRGWDPDEIKNCLSTTPVDADPQIISLAAFILGVTCAEQLQSPDADTVGIDPTTTTNRTESDGGTPARDETSHRGRDLHDGHDR